MKKITTIFLSLLGMAAFSQNTKTLEGYYDLSEFEMPASLFLLNNETFYFSAIFGAVDLEVYGTYTIKGDQLYFEPYEKLMQPYVLYARKNSVLKDAISFNYNEPEDDYNSLLVFAVNDQWVMQPDGHSDRGEVEFKVKTTALDSLKIGFPAHIKIDSTIQVLETYTAEIKEGDNDFLLSYNRFYEMRRRFSKKPLQLKGDTIITGDKKRTKEPLRKEDKEKMIAFLNEYEMFPAEILSRENRFQKLALKKEIKKRTLAVSTDMKLTEIENTSNNTEMTVNIELLKKNYKIDESINILFSITNTSQSFIEFCYWQTPLEGQFTANYFEVIHDGNILPYKGKMVKRRPPTQSDLILIPSKEQFGQPIELNTAYDLDKTGDYKIRFLGSEINKLSNSNSIDFTINKK